MPAPSRPIPELAREVTPREIDELFRDAHFPSDRQQLVNYARSRFASADLLAVLDTVPDRIYQNPNEIFHAVKGLAA